MGFDMTKVKVGDNLVTDTGKIVRVEKFDEYDTKLPYLLSNGIWYHPNGVDCTGTEGGDIIGFANKQELNELQAVELLLSLGYTLKKGSN